LRNDFLEIEQKEKETDRMVTTDAHSNPRRLRMPTGLFSFRKKHSNRQR